MRHQILPGNKDSAEIRDLEGGVSYSVRVTALVGDREGSPVSIVVTTRRRIGGLDWGLCPRGGLMGLDGCRRLEKGSRIYSEPVWAKSWGRWANVVPGTGAAYGANLLDYRAFP